MGTAADPIKDLMQELAAEDAAEAAKTAGDEPAEQAEVEAKANDAEETDEERETRERAEEAAAEEGKTPPVVAKGGDKAGKAKDGDKPAKKQGFVPVSRMNEEAAKRRRAENDLSKAQERIAALEAAPAGPDGKPKPVSEEDRKQIQAEARAQARMEVLAENFVSAGHEAYGKKEFDTISQTLADLGAPDNLVMITVEATGSPTAAAKAIFNLAQLDSEEIETLFKSSPIRIGAKMGALAAARRAAAPKGEEPGEGDEEVKAAPKGGKGAKQQSQAPAPLKPVNGTGKVADTNEITDDLSEDQFTERFNKLPSQRVGVRH